MNTLAFSTPVWLLFASGLASLGIAVYLFIRRAPGSAALGVLALLIAEWSATYGLEIAAYALEEKIFWGQLQYIAIAFIPFVWLAFALSYENQRENRPAPRYLYLLGVVPFITTALALTNGAHKLVWQETFLKPAAGAITVLGVKYGVWFWAHFAVSYLLLLGGSIVLFRSLRRVKGLYRAQTGTLFFAALLPWVGNAIYFVTPIAFDPTPFAFTLTVLLLAWAIFGYRLTDITPIARSMVMEGLRDGVIVLDSNARIVDINPAPVRMIGLPVGALLGSPIAEAIAPWQDALAHFRGAAEVDEKISIGQGEMMRRYHIQIMPLQNAHGSLIGRVITLRELSQSAPPAPTAARHAVATTPLTETKPAPQRAPAPQTKSDTLWSRLSGFLLPERLDISAMPGRLNPLWETAIEQSITLIARYAMVFGSIVGGYIVFDAVAQRNMGYAFVVLAFLAGAYFLALARTAPFRLRMTLFLSLAALMAFVELLRYGFAPNVFIYFMALVIISHVLLDLRGGLQALGLAMLTLTLFAWAVLSGMFAPFESGHVGFILPTDSASAATQLTGFLLAALSIITVINLFMTNMNQAWKKEAQASTLLQREQELLEQRVRERTAELREARDLALQSRDDLRKYYQVIEQSGSSILITDVQGTIQYVNPFFEQITGYSQQEVIGKNPRILKSGHQSPEFYRQMWKTIANGQVWRGEFLNRRKDGSLYWELATIAPVKDENGKIVNYVGIKEDITVQKELRETLARQNNYLSTLQTITLEMLERRDEQELLETILQRARAMLNADRSVIALAEGEQLIYRSVIGEHADQYGQPVPRDAMPLLWKAFETRRPVVVDDFTARYGPRAEDAGNAPLRALVNFPILTGGHAIGVLGLGRTGVQPFTNTDIEFGQALAQIAALVLDNITLYNTALRELEKRKRIQASLQVSEQEQRALAGVLQVGMKDDPLDDILRASLDYLLGIEWLGIEAKGGIFLKDPQKDTLILTANRNLSPQIGALCSRVDFGKCLCGRAALTRQLQFSSHLDELHEITYEGIPDHGHYNIPILRGDDVLGVIVLYLPAGYQYNARDVQFLQAYSDVLSNIIRRKATEENLRESEVRFRQIVENASDIIYRMDSLGRMTYVNPVGLRLMGYESEQEVFGKHFTEFTHPSWRSRVKAFYKKQALKGEQNTYYEFQALTKDGRQVWLGQNVQVIRLPDGSQGFQAVARDITELKETQLALAVARDQALDASRFKSQLLSRVSHELRTPLGGVIGYAELLHQGAFGELSDEQLDAAQNIVASANYLNIMINELLDQAQIEARAMTIAHAPFTPEILLRNVENTMRILAQSKGLQLITELDPALPARLVGDERRLQQVMINLTGNAIKFTQQGEVRLSLLRLDDAHWSIRVADTGAGIPKEAQDYIFEPFRQVNNAITRNNRGTGLGLSITKQLVELMGGRIELDSEVGRGSTFTIVLPIQTPQES